MLIRSFLAGCFFVFFFCPIPWHIDNLLLAAVGSPEWFSGVVYGSQHMARPAVKLLSLVVFELLPEFCGLTPECLEPSQVSQENLRCGEGISDLCEGGEGKMCVVCVWGREKGRISLYRLSEWEEEEMEGDRERIKRERR